MNNYLATVEPQSLVSSCCLGQRGSFDCRQATVFSARGRPLPIPFSGVMSWSLSLDTDWGTPAAAIHGRGQA